MLLACVGPCLAAAVSVQAQAPARLSVTEQTTPDALIGFDGRRQDAERTTLTIIHGVPGAGERASLEVGYLRLRAQAPTGRSPIVFLMGGPGVPATVIGRIPPYWTLFRRLREVADVILLDQRGVGISSPVIDCPSGRPPPPDFLLSTAALREALRTTYARCVATWRARGFPPELFGVGEIAADVEAIRRQLDVPRLSLLGFSYGTRLALEYARLFPDRVDRVVLQGTMGFDDVARLPPDLDAVLARVSTAAAGDSVARSLAPDLQAAVAELFRNLERQPVHVTAPGDSGRSVELTVGSEGVRALVAGGIADPRLPALIASLRDGDTRLLATRVGGIYHDLANGGGSLFGRAVYCSAPASASREGEARALAPGSVLGAVFDNIPATPEFCRDIGIAPGPPAEPPARALDRPALIITGTLDDRSPLPNAERAGTYFTRPTLVTVEHGGHELLPIDRVADLVVTYFATGAVTGDRLAVAPPRYLTVEEALRPPARR